MTERIKFSVRALLLIVLGLSLLAGALGAPPSAMSCLLLWGLACSLPGCLALGVHYSRGTTRAFCIGSLFPAILPLLVVQNQLYAMGCGYGGYTGTSYARVLQFITGSDAFVSRPVVAAAWLLSVIAGVVTAAFYRLGFVRRKGAQ